MPRLALIIGLVLWPALSQAQALEQQVSDELAAQGFAVTAMYRTWLGRLRVIAESDSYYRELVFDPATGELLQDYADLLSDRAQRRAATAGDSRDRWADTVAEPETGVSVMVPAVDTATLAPPGGVMSTSVGTGGDGIAE